MELHLIQPDGELLLYQGELELRFKVLREPLGMGRDTVRVEGERESLHLVLEEDDVVLGCLMATPEGTTGARLRQMAVLEARQGRGLGRQLLGVMEQHLQRFGLLEVSLHARRYAIGFYEKLGFSCVGEVFTEVGLPHRKMVKTLPRRR